MPIRKILFREILDSRGNKTIEAEVYSAKNVAVAAAPSGASVGRYESPAFPKKGSSEAIKIFKKKLQKKITGAKIDYKAVDAIVKEFDPKREIIGGNLSVALSLAVAKLQAAEKGIPFYELTLEGLLISLSIKEIIDRKKILEKFLSEVNIEEKELQDILQKLAKIAPRFICSLFEKYSKTYCEGKIDKLDKEISPDKSWDHS